jgi:Flp pilus assembly protein TadD
MNRVWQGTAVALICASTPACATRAARVRLPATPPAIERQVRNAVLAPDQDGRLKSLQQKVAAAPGDLAARLALVDLYLERSLPELAAEHCRLAAPRFASSEPLHVAWAKALYRAELYREGADVMAGFLDRSRRASAGAFSWLGILYDEAGYLEHGETAHRSASALEPNSAALRNNLGFNLLRQGRKAEAAAEFRRALEAEPGSAFARNNLALALIAPEAAPKPGSKAARNESELRREALVNWRATGDAASAHNNLAAAMIEQGRYREARDELAEALRLDRSCSRALANLRLVSELDGKPAEFPITAPVSAWQRCKSALKKTFTASEPESRQQRTAHAPARHTERP